MLSIVKWGAALLFGAPAAAIAGQAEQALSQVASQWGNPSNDAAIAGAVAQWKRLDAMAGNASFSDYANFLIVNPGWPGEMAYRRAAEKNMVAGGYPPGLAVQFFQKFPPLTAPAALRYAQALMMNGQSAQANEAARMAWTLGAMSPTDESALLSQFGAALRPEDHDKRVDILLWQNAPSSAARILPMTSIRARDTLTARVAFRNRGPDAASYAGRSSPGDSDAGYLADKATWYKLAGASPSARTLLANRPALTGRPSNVEKWYELLLEQAKAAQAAGDNLTAFRIASRVDDAYPDGTRVSDQSYGERDEFTNLTWFAGQTAMKRLGRPADAIPMFQSYSRGSRAPQVQAKGVYWAGRAAQAAGRTQEANAFFTQAFNGYSDQFYGQLAGERLGLAMKQPSTAPLRDVDGATRNAWLGRGVVRAAQYLGRTGDYTTQSLFVRQIAADAKTDADHALGTQLAGMMNRPDLNVMIGRSALTNGLSDFRAVGYPTVPVPPGYDTEFTMIHAIARQESQFDRAAISHAGARGLMQLMPGTAREQAGKLGLGYDFSALTVDTQYNIKLGSSYFQRMYANYGSYPLAVAAYNAGPGNVNKWLRANGDPRLGGIDWIDWIEAIPIYETKNYVQRVLENAVVYDTMYPNRARSSGPARLSWYLGRRPGN